MLLRQMLNAAKENVLRRSSSAIAGTASKKTGHDSERLPALLHHEPTQDEQPGACPENAETQVSCLVPAREILWFAVVELDKTKM